MNNGHIINKVFPESIAQEMGIVPGDKLVKINDNYIQDLLDYYYMVNDEYLEIMIYKQDGANAWILEIEKDYDELLGIEFEQPVMADIKRCENNCIFCFVNQMPGGLRDSLYVKDDDYRLSFLSGNYITLTNLGEKELDRIKRYRISPLYISIHTTRPQLRKKMMNNKKAGLIMDQLEILKQAGIELYGQIVLCPGYNDGEELDKTLEDLYLLWPEFKNVAVVPVGLTGYRDFLPEIRPTDKEKAKDIINKVHSYQERFMSDLGSRFVFLADEFYLLAEEELPLVEEYEDFTQLENGVGLLRKFEYETNLGIEEIKQEYDHLGIQGKQKENDFNISVVTGTASKELIKKTLTKITDYLDLSNPIKIFEVGNGYFGGQVTVTGLITGQDILNELYGKNIGDYLLIPEIMLKDQEDLFLDGLKLEDLETSLNVKVIKTPVHGGEFVKLLRDLLNLGIEMDKGWLN